MAAKRKRGSNLPFIVQPRREPIIEVLGTEESGQIEMKRLGYLTVAEKMYVQSTVTADGSVAALHRLAARISNETEVPVQQVLQDFAEDRAYLKPYSLEISEALTMMMSYQEKLRIVSVAALLTLRVNDQITIEDVMDLHPDLMDAIYLLYLEEEEKSIAAFEKREEDEAAQTAEQVGK
jgi:hypothetical protein